MHNGVFCRREPIGQARPGRSAAGRVPRGRPAACGSAGDMAEAGRLDDKLGLPFGLGLVVQFEVCPGEHCRVEARFAADPLGDRDDGRVHARPRQMVVQYLHVRAQRGLADGQGCVFLVGVQREAAAGEQQAPAALTQLWQDGVGRDPGAQDPDGRASGPVLVVTADGRVIAGASSAASVSSLDLSRSSMATGCPASANPRTSAAPRPGPMPTITAVPRVMTVLSSTGWEVMSPAGPVGPHRRTARRPAQARGLFTSSGTDSALTTFTDVASGDVSPFRVQSVRTRIRFPDMTDR